MRIRFFFLCVMFLFLLTSCRVTKFVPEGEYLLNKVEIKTDNKDVKKEELKKYLHQTPNSSVFGIWRMQLRIYSTAGKDTTKWLNRVLIRSGEPPVIYDENKTYLSEQSLEKALQNKGYMHAEVSSQVELNKKKAEVTYFIKENEPYRLRNYEVNVDNPDLLAVATDSVNSLIKKDMLFDVDVFNAERERITKDLRREGFYKFTKDLLYYPADSTLDSKQVDVMMKLREFDEERNDSIQNVIFTKYIIRHVVFVTSRNFSTVGSTLSQSMENYEIEELGNYILVNDDKDFLRMGTLIDNTFIEPDKYYSDASVEKTYNALNALPPVKYVNINFREIGSDSLDCLIMIAPTKLLSLTADIEATYTDRFWGAAASLGTTHRNVFKGAESLSLQGRLAYEWQGDVLASEWGAQAGLLFPNFLMPFTTSEFRKSIRANTEFTTNISYQKRPSEFTVGNFGIGMKYAWTQSRFKHNFELIDVSLVHFPEITQAFWDNFLENNKFNRYNYEDHLITRIGYIGSFSTFNANRPLKNYYSMRYSLETAGNLLYGINSLFGGKKDENGSYTIFDIPYSQYVRGDFNISFHQIIDENNRFVYHFGLGAGTPYGNADIIPYERRYFSGGANSVRGWSEGMLGPGVYNRDSLGRGGRRDFNQVGDIKLDLNVEYRYKMFRSLNGAVFIDGGNIWTIKPYETQKGGAFSFDTFYKQIALSYGVGLRLDLSFVVVRLDLGVKLFNPVLAEGDRWRTKLNKNDFALHFAIGYPF